MQSGDNKYCIYMGREFFSSHIFVTTILKDS